MFSLTSEYAMRAMIYLTRHADDRPIPGREIAEETHIPPRYLSTILGDLVRAGILHSSPGTGGGFRMVRSPKEVTLSEVLVPFEPVLTDCRSCPFGNEQCADDHPCAGHDLWRKVREMYSRFLEKTSVYDVTIPRRNRRAAGSAKRTKR